MISNIGKIGYSTTSSRSTQKQNVGFKGEYAEKYYEKIEAGDNRTMQEALDVFLHPHDHQLKIVDMADLECAKLAVESHAKKLGENTRHKLYVNAASAFSTLAAKGENLKSDFAKYAIKLKKPGMR